MYQYCNSHHAGDTRSVTERAFFGWVRNCSNGDRLSGDIEEDEASKGIFASRVVVSLP